MSTRETLEPTYERLDNALRSIGYSFEMAVADVVDNSIDAGAGRILVRVLVGSDGSLGLAIVDNGCGMSSEELREAMRFGANEKEQLDKLKKFGIGLKLASLSQAKELHVITRRGNSMSGRAWEEDGIKKGFLSTVHNEAECRKRLELSFPEWRKYRNGTVVVWQNLTKVSGHHDDLDAAAQKLIDRLARRLSLVFHRFLDGRGGRRISIEMDIFDQDRRSAGIPVPVDPLDPFGYERSALLGFPQMFHLAGDCKDKMRLRLHLWPPNSASPCYKLPGGANQMQGFYFYRNDRLLQAGGWWGLREVETHTSLARVEVEIDPSIDLDLSLDVKKSAVHLPPKLAAAFEAGKTKSGLTLKQYFGLADKAYRKRQLKVTELPVVPLSGLPAALREFLRNELKLKGTAKTNKISIKWGSLEDDCFFWVNPDEPAIYLNKAFRRALLCGRNGSSADIPVIKTLLFFLLSEAFSAERFGPRLKERLDLLNRTLVQAVRFEGS